MDASYNRPLAGGWQIMIKQALKSKTIQFNAVMGIVDMLIANAVFLQDLITIKQFAVTILVLKSVQTVGNLYLRSITTESLNDK